AESRGWPRAVSIQNPYNLLNRSFEVGLAEVAIREQCGLLAYSPLAFGMLSGKYENGARPGNARLTLFSRFARYSNPQTVAAC
ncbi:aldo/keto reductase, partial [Pseudoalteromonas sp. SIMBA_153]